MKKTLLVIAAVGALALSACSSDDTPDANPGDGTPNPQVTDDNPNPGGSDFCQMIADTEDIGDDLNAAQEALDDLTDDQANWDSPETVAALHAQGQALLDYADDIAAVYDQAAVQAGDPEVSQAFSTLADYFRMMFLALGQAAVEADSVMDYYMNMGTYIDQDAFSDMTDELTDAGPLISEYVYDTCGYSEFDFE